MSSNPARTLNNAVPLAEIADRVHEELQQLARLVEQFQQALGGIVNGAADARSPGFISEAQKLDMLLQGLHGLSSFLIALKPSMHGNWVIDAKAAAGVVTLAQLAARLAGDAADAHEGDDFVLF